MNSWQLATAGLLVACGGSSGRTPGSCDGPCPASKIDHVVVIVQENHTFDAYFGQYCTAPTGSAPTCTSGPACCEAGPGSDPSGAAPIVLDDAMNAARDPDHSQPCELSEMDGSAMDKYVTGATCSNPGNFAYAAPDVVAPYRALAGSGALADRYFQPIVGQSSSNDMYLARAQYVFTDNAFEPEAIGAQCSLTSARMDFPDPTIGDVLAGSGVSWAFYAEGYQDMVDAGSGTCPAAAPGCPAGLSIYPCVFDPGDNPFAYYAADADKPATMRDLAKLQADLDGDTLPQVAFVKGLGFHSEHPGYGTKISDGATFVTGVIDAIAASDYAPDTLILVTWDEGGGYFDHVAPPPVGTDGQAYGTRVPLLALGPFARANTISHVTLEHSSIVAFLEWNWLGMQTGQLGGRDATIANLGSLLDPAKTGVAVP